MDPVYIYILASVMSQSRIVILFNQYQPRYSCHEKIEDEENRKKEEVEMDLNNIRCGKPADHMTQSDMVVTASTASTASTQVIRPVPSVLSGTKRRL
jgi:uncharacterized CHY-type Zn-finger protein